MPSPKLCTIRYVINIHFIFLDFLCDTNISFCASQVFSIEQVATAIYIVGCVLQGKECEMKSKGNEVFQTLVSQLKSDDDGVWNSVYINIAHQVRA